MTRAGVCLVVALLLAGCGGGAPGATGTGDAVSGEVPRPSGSGPPDLDDVCVDGVDGARVEQAFLGTVVAVDEGAATPWVSFAVERWFSESLADTVGVWTPGAAPQVGERWLVAASRYSQGELDRAGTLLPCDSELATDEGVSAFVGAYGDGFPRRSDAEVTGLLAELDEAETRWAEVGPTSWTATIVLYAGSGAATECGDRGVRVVVDDGEVVQARDVASSCDVPLDEAPLVDDLFDAVREHVELLGAVSYHPDGYVEYLEAGPHTDPVALGYVSELVPSAQPVADGDPAADLAAARARWEAAGVQDYSLRVEERCFCSPMVAEVRVVAGEIVRAEVPQDEPEAVVPDALTVEDLFARVERGLAYDSMAVRYDDELGVPLLVVLDDDTNASDDESTIEVTDLEVDRD